MHFLRLIQSDRQANLKGLVGLLMISGLGNAALIGMINHMAELAAFGEPVTVRLVLLYFVLFTIFAVANNTSWRRSNRILQHRLSMLRLRVVDRVRNAPLRALEQMKHGDLLATVNHETNTLSQNLPLLTGAVQSVFLIGFSLLYIATLSAMAFVIVAGFGGIGVALYWRGRSSMNAAMRGVYLTESETLSGMINFTQGFKEVRMNADRNDALFARFTSTTDHLKTAVTDVAATWIRLMQFSNAFIYALLGAVIFVLPLYFQGYTDVIYKVVAAAAFCLGPLTAITSVSHLFASTEVGLARIEEIETKLTDIETNRDGTAVPDPHRFRGFRHLRFRDIEFRYVNEQGQVEFTSGPWDLDIDAGKILFITGGNGSGKSTAMKLIAGLYAPDAGTITIDDVPIIRDNRAEYRELFSAVFSDFHLFDRLYGLGDVDPKKVDRLIARMGLTDKVTFEDGRFSTLNLSTGQRKRLAMIVCLLEDRDIYVFDEWAADQDADFRNKFYTELLPYLKARGKALVVVTHDDLFWDHSDRRVTLDLGRIVEVK